MNSNKVLTTIQKFSRNLPNSQHHVIKTTISIFKTGNKNAGTTPLNWESRLKIMQETAKALAYLHEEPNPKFCHGNIRSSNILLTPDLQTLVSDYGISQLISNLSRSSLPYLAPEFPQTRKLTRETDIYAFGVVLLEILTGKSPSRAHGNEEIFDLPRWVQSVVREEWTAEVFDLELMKCGNIEEEMVGLLQIALACASRDPQQRPSIDELVRMMEDLRHDSDHNRLK